jgi:hypothetical protein
MDDDAKYKRIRDESRDFLLAAPAEADKEALKLERKRTAPIRLATFGVE